MEAIPARSPKTTASRWQLAFSAIVQAVGLAIIVYETIVVQKDRPWLLLVAVAMMLGGTGLQFILRAVLALGGGPGGPE